MQLVWGPLCFLCALTTALPGGRSLRHPLRILACMAHLYGVALYYATSLCELWFTGRSHSRPEPIYFWGYYFGFNLPWVVVPAGESSLRTYSSLFPPLTPFDLLVRACVYIASSSIPSGQGIVQTLGVETV